MRLPRSADGRARISSGCSSMKLVVMCPARKSGWFSTAPRKGRLVATPRMRNSAMARRARRAALSKSCPWQVSLTSIESKCAETSAPVWTVPPSSRTPGPPGER
ncbi:hypothetical protein GCM10020227_57700 [Streptomyces flavovirens]